MTSYVELGASDSPFSVPISGASVGVDLGPPKTIEHLSRHAYVNLKVIKSQTVIGTG